LRGAGFRPGFLEIQVRLVVGMSGAVRVVQQAFNRWQSHARMLPAVGSFVKFGGRCIARRG